MIEICSEEDIYKIIKLKPKFEKYLYHYITDEEISYRWIYEFNRYELFKNIKTKSNVFLLLNNYPYSKKYIEYFAHFFEKKENGRWLCHFLQNCGHSKLLEDYLKNFDEEIYEEYQKLKKLRNSKILKYFKKIDIVKMWTDKAGE